MLDGHAPPLLDRIAGGHTCVVRSATRENDDPAQVGELVVGHPETLEDEPPVPEPVADRLGHGFWLLVDLLEHERLEAALLGSFEIPVELLQLELDR